MQTHQKQDNKYRVIFLQKNKTKKALTFVVQFNQDLYVIRSKQLHVTKYILINYKVNSTTNYAESDAVFGASVVQIGCCYHVCCNAKLLMRLQMAQSLSVTIMVIY